MEGIAGEQVMRHARNGHFLRSSLWCWTEHWYFFSALWRRTAFVELLLCVLLAFESLELDWAPGTRWQPLFEGGPHLMMRKRPGRERLFSTSPAHLFPGPVTKCVQFCTKILYIFVFCAVWCLRFFLAKIYVYRGLVKRNFEAFFLFHQ